MITAQHPIKTPKDLRAHLQYAIGLELTTVPAYLCALYSISPGANSAAREAIQSVVLEEMLHMALAANVLNAIGGKPSTGRVNRGASPVPKKFPAQPSYINGIPKIHLRKFSPKAIQDFIAIEHPGEKDPSDNGTQYASIGAFYEAIQQGLYDHCPKTVFAAARRDRKGCQVSGHDYYGGAGTLIEVTDLKSAIDALEEIVTEGEGLPRAALNQTASEDKRSGTRTPGRGPGLGPYAVDDAGVLVVSADQLAYGWKMYSHYARFMEILYGRRYWPDQPIKDIPDGAILPTDWDAVRPMATDPTAEKYHDYTWAYEPMKACNHTYTALVNATYAGFNGQRDALREAVGLMYKLKYQAEALFNTPSPLPDEAEEGWTLGPAFEYLHDQNNPSR
jgi:Ferritin-like